MTRFFSSFLFLSAIVLANNEFDLDDDFLNSLDEVSEIATKSKLNIDDSPSFISVLENKKLEKLGINNVFEALSLIPGVELQREVSGVPVVVFRGIKQKGEVKLMFNGITINNSYRGSIYHYLDFPVELIKRIEIIRGAGSVLYGSGAISGVINIITNSAEKSSKNKIFASVGTYNNYQGGAFLSTNIDSFKITIDSYYQEHEKTIETPLKQESDRHLTNLSLGLNINYDNFSFLSRIKKSDMGNAYGIFSSVDQSSKNFYNKNTSLLTQLSYTKNITQENKINVLTSYTTYNQSVEANYKNIATIDANYKEDTYLFQADVISTSIKDNQLLIGTNYELANTLESTLSSLSPISDPTLKRKTLSFYLNNQYSLSESLDISTGLRYDNYSDFGDSYSPNLGLVYRLNEKIKLKALYSEAFRAPSWVELTSNENLLAESSHSIETGIIFKQNLHNLIRINFYATLLHDMITKDINTNKYIQNSKNEFIGSELEYIYAPNNKMELNLFASYIDASDDNGDDLIDIANILLKTSFYYELDNGISFGSLVKYASSPKRELDDTRARLSDSFLFDQTISYSYKNIVASFIVKDLFNSKRFYSLPKNDDNLDFDDGGRTFMLKTSMSF